MAIRAAGDPELRGIVVPTTSAEEAAVVEGIDVIPVNSLTQAVAFFSGQIDIPPAPTQLNELFDRYSAYEDDYADVRGLSTEARQKLATGRPETIGQAARISGMTPAAISLLLVHLKRRALGGTASERISA